MNGSSADTNPIDYEQIVCAGVMAMLSDLRFALRLFRRTPMFAVTTVLTLALGIGANLAVFTIVDAVLFRPLPFPEPDRLVMLSESHLETNQHRAGVLP